MNVALRLAPLPTSSGSVERLVSIFTRNIDSQSRRSKEETIEARCLYSYNHRRQGKRRRHRFDDDVPAEPFLAQSVESQDEESEEIIEEGQVDVLSLPD